MMVNIVVVLVCKFVDGDEGGDEDGDPKEEAGDGDCEEEDGPG